MRIGFDLDNTLICYDNAFHAAGVARGLFLANDVIANKTLIRDFLQTRGEAGVKDWQALQGYVYGPGIHTAQLFPGVLACLAELKQLGHEFCIISHKTTHGHFDSSRTNLHEAARQFLAQQHVTSYIAAERIFFCPTLDDKVSCIAEQQCRFFVDDLLDVLEHKVFPVTTRGILFRSHTTYAGASAASWQDVLTILTSFEYVQQ